jgi:hypothetical protein
MGLLHCLCFILTLGVTFSPLMIYFGISTIYDEIKLNSNGIVTNAAVIDDRVSQDSDTTRYEIKYQFTVDQSNVMYSCSDRSGRRSL